MVADLRAKFIQEGIVTLPGFLKQCAIPDIIKVRRIDFYILDTVHCQYYLQYNNSYLIRSSRYYIF